MPDTAAQTLARHQLMHQQKRDFGHAGTATGTGRQKNTSCYSTNAEAAELERNCCELVWKNNCHTSIEYNRVWKDGDRQRRPVNSRPTLNWYIFVQSAVPRMPKSAPPATAAAPLKEILAYKEFRRCNMSSSMPPEVRLGKQSECQNEGNTAERRSEFSQSHNPLFEADRQEERSCDARMVLLCCRIHPLIRDSASVKTVPFYVEWWRDYTSNGSRTWSVKFFLPFVLICFVGAFLLELLIPRDKKEGSEFKVTDNSWVELTLLSVGFVRVFVEPSIAVVSFLYYKISGKAKYQGALSWHLLQNVTDTVRTTMVALLPWKLPPDRNLEVLKLPALLAHVAFDKEGPIVSKSETSSMRYQVDSDRQNYLAATSIDDRQKPNTYNPNRESSSGHWDECWGDGISCPMHSSWPQAEEWTEQMSLNEVMRIGDRGIREAYKAYLQSGNLRLAMERLMDKLEKNNLKDLELEEWLIKWRNCWQEIDIEDTDGDDCRYHNARRMIHMLEAWSKQPRSWGPPLKCLELPITVINKDGLGVLLVPQRLLSSLLPRYGHKAYVDEIAYMSAKAVVGDQRYYRPRATLFWLITTVFVRILLLATARFDDNDNEVYYALIASVTALGIWLQFAKGAFDMDLNAMVRGRLLQGCIVQSAWGVRQKSHVVSSGEVTAALLAKWNANVAIESHALLNSFHTERWSDTDQRVKPMDLEIFQKAGGLLLGDLAIIPGRKDLRIRRLKLRDQVYELGYSVLSINYWHAKDIVSHSPCPVGGFIEDALGDEDDESIASIEAMVRQRSTSSILASIEEAEDVVPSHRLSDISIV